MSRLLAERLSALIANRTSRRGFLARSAVVGAALATDPISYILRPATAYASVCGEGASCSSGWTAFCVTVNDGVNKCPPGSYTAGWWKADHASVCGGGARYYVDCNAQCIHGRSGHYGCSCRCAPGNTCDKRHTCCNQFRYGQCHQNIACYGPVVCRVVSCVPPWKWADCSTAAATDNRTRSHSAPDLPHHWDDVERRYVALDDAKSPLGASIGGRHRVRHGLVQYYEHGLLAWSPATPAAMLLGAMADAYRHLGGAGGRLGFPEHDQRPAKSGKGRLASFTGGVIFVAGRTVAHAFDGPLLPRWRHLVDEGSELGLPDGSPHLVDNGRGALAEFRHGVLLWSAATGAHFVSHAAADRYAALHRQHSSLGYPIHDTVATPDGHGTVSRFERGAIVFSPRTGAWELTADAFTYWAASGGGTGELGYPTAAPADVDGVMVQAFTDGRLFSSPDSGCHAVLPDMLPTYDANGGPAGPLGPPVGDQQPDGTTTAMQMFRGGKITYDLSSGTSTVELNSRA